MRLFRPGFLAGCLYPEAIFRIKTTEKKLYLTFDDGPDPKSTPQILEILHKYHISAIFFCNGRSAESHPDLINSLSNRGHLIGNHGYNHLDGWRTETTTYTEDIRKASQFTSDKIFRPPFGRLSHKQRVCLKSYKLVLWDLMPYDFDVSFGGDHCLKVLEKKIRPGSIIVLHDSVTSCANIILEKFILFALYEGYQFEIIDFMA